MTAVDVVVVAHGESPHLQACVESVLASTADVHVVVVDNGGTGGVVARFDGRDGVTVLRPGTNTGFAGGCNLGAAAGTGEVVALVNPDVVLEPDALGRLASVALEPDVGVATASLRLADAPDRLNSAGNPVHYLGVAWAGAYGQPAAAHAERVPVASASGACCALRRTIWTRLQGFDEHYFAYHEDVELSLRCWQLGLQVVYVPDAIARHHYEFGRNAGKNYLLERNRWLTLLTLFSSRTLLLLAPALLLFEVLVLGAATVQGWLPAKLAGYRWLVSHAAVVRRRRALVQGQRIRSDRELAPLLAGRLEPANLPAAPGQDLLNAVLARYWGVVRRAL